MTFRCNLWTIPLLIWGSAAFSFEFYACEDLLDRSNYENEAGFAPLRYDPQENILFRQQDFIAEFELGSQEAAYFKKIAETLKEQGIVLALLLNPPRGLMYDPAIGTRLLPEPLEFQHSLVRANYNTLLAELTDLGIAAPNLVDFTSQRGTSRQYYYAGNSHWTPDGAIEAALGVRQELERQFQLDFPPLDENYRISGMLDIADTGNLMRAVAQVCEKEPVVETRRSQVIERVSAEDETVSSALFGDAPAQDPQIALLGTSFSNGNSRDKFQATPAFEYALQGPIINRSVHAGGSVSAMEAFFTDADRADVEIVAWEMKPDQFVQLDKMGLAQILGAVMPACTQGPITRDSQTQVLDTSWRPIGDWVVLQDLLNITLPVGLTTDLEVRVTSADGVEQIYKLHKKHRIPDDWLSGRWTLYLGDPEDSFPEGNPRRIEARIPNAAAPVAMTAQLCTSAL